MPCRRRLQDPSLSPAEATAYQQYLVSAALIVCGRPDRQDAAPCGGAPRDPAGADPRRPPLCLQGS